MTLWARFMDWWKVKPAQSSAPASQPETVQAGDDPQEQHADETQDVFDAGLGTGVTEPPASDDMPADPAP